MSSRGSSRYRDRAGFDARRQAAKSGVPSGIDRVAGCGPDARLRDHRGGYTRRNEDHRRRKGLRQFLGAADRSFRPLLLLFKRQCDVDGARVSVPHAVELRTHVESARARRSARLPCEPGRGTVTRLSLTLLLPVALLAQSGAGDWKTYGQNTLGWRYSELNQIDTKSVARLAPRWIFQSGMSGGFVTA